ncbi:N-acetyl-D-glucosamine kinase [Streptomyces violaceorubidus]
MRRMTARPANAHQARLLQLLRDGGPNSRAQLGDQVDLSRSKLAVEVDRLLETGLVVADGLAASRGGRRSHNVRLNPELRFLGVDIGATSVDVAVTNAELEILGHINQPMDVREGPVAVFEQVLSMAAKLRASGLAEGFDGAGIGVPGPVRFPEGVPVAPPIMPGWDGFPVREALSQELGCPVMVDNDVNLMALGEQHAGVARTQHDFLVVKIGTGIGCGIVVGGDVYRGTTGSAGDIGHIQAVPDWTPVRLRQPWLPGSPLQRRGPGPRRHGGRPARAVGRAREPAGGRTGASAPPTSPPRPPRATPPRWT